MTGETRIDRLVKGTRRRLFWPAVLRTFGPVILWLIVFAVATLLGALNEMSSAARALAAIVFYIGVALLIWQGWRTWKSPSDADSRELVDRLSEDRPATTVIDAPVDPTPVGEELWRAHVERVQFDARSLPSPSIFSRVREADPYFLRILAPAVLVLAGVAAGDRAAPRLMASLVPDVGALAGADQLSAQAWVSPPAYTNRAPFILPNGGIDVSPQGSEVTIRIDSPRAPTLTTRDGKKRERMKLERGPDGAFEATLTLEESLDARLHLWGERARFSLDSIEDLPPEVLFVSAPEGDENNRTNIEWRVSDDNGVTALQLLLRPVDEKLSSDIRFLSKEDPVAISLPQIDPKLAESKSVLDLTRHKWAGLQVEGRLRATDAAGNIGETEAVNFRMPSRLWLQPTAQAVIETRFEVLREPRTYNEPDENTDTLEINEGRYISAGNSPHIQHAPEGVKRAALMLEGLTYKVPENAIEPAFYLGLRRAYEKLRAARNKTHADDVDDLLWSVAMHAEYGTYMDAEEALARAKQALERALRDGASEEEIRQLTQAFRKAVEDYIAAKLAEAIEKGQSLAEALADDMDGGGPNLGDDQLEAMLKALEELTETGAHDQARELLSNMEQMLQNLMIQLGQGGGEGMTGPPQEGPLADAMRELGEQLLDQRELNDNTERSRDQAQQQESGLPTQGDAMTADELAQRQEQLSEQMADALDRMNQPPANGPGETGEMGEDMPGTPGMPGPGGQGQESGGPGSDPAGQAEGSSSDGQPGSQAGQDGEGGTGQMADGTGQPGTGGTRPDGNADQQAGIPGDGSGARPGGNRPGFEDRMAQAREAQRRAAEALARGDLDAARAAQDDAMRQMSRAATEMAQAADMLENGANAAQGQTGDQTDPLGRPSGNGVAGNGDDVTVPGQSERQRAGAILRELRRRADERNLTPDELDYLRRLLDRF